MKLNIPKGIFLTFLVSLISCNGNIKNESATEIQSDSKEITHEFVQVSKKLDNHSTAEYEYIISKEKDSFLNQTRIYKSRILDTLKSRFYDLKIIKSNGLNHSGHIYYRNYLDTLGLEINKNRWVFLYLEQQITQDSIVHKIFVSEDGKNIYYEYSDFENGYISGYIEDTALVPTMEKDSLGEEITRHIEQPMNIQKRIKLNK